MFRGNRFRRFRHFFIPNEFVLYRLCIRRTSVSNIYGNIIDLSATSRFYMFMIYCTIDNTRNREKKTCSTECGARVHLLIRPAYSVSS